MGVAAIIESSSFECYSLTRRLVGSIVRARLIIEDLPEAGHGP